MNAPNIFDFATSELSQDAVLAYFLHWADPQYRSINPEMNKLGEDLLNEMLNKIEYKDRNRPIKIEKLHVKTQDNRIDVSVKINDKIFLIIEDKVNTGTHSKQIKRYKEAQKGKYGEGNVFALYLKTGNESVATTDRNKENADGKLLRQDLLAVLERHSRINNVIHKEFTDYLRRKEDATQSFKKKKISDWQSLWDAHEGYYGFLEETFPKKVNWGYEANPAGGSLVLYWDGKQHMKNCQNTKNCQIYLQIDHIKGLFIRVSVVKNSNNEPVKVSSPLQWELLEIAKRHAQSIDGVEVIKPNRFGSGWTANFARLLFDGEEGDSGDAYMAKDKEGIIDLNRTIERLKKANKLVSAMCNE